jgi:hypothetical protein
MRVQHFDRIDVRWDASTLQVNADGSRTVDGFGAHVGPYTYHDDKGRPFVELVPPSTLFEPASLDSAAGSTLTIRHGPGLVTPDRYREEAHGAWVRAWDAGGGNLGVRLRVASAEGLAFVDDAIAKGDSVELSPVYEVDVVDRDGELVQEGRRYSGIALLGPNEARGGPTAKLNLDGPECAPAGSRVQVLGPRLDSAPRANVHSETGRPNTMKQATLKNPKTGRARSVSLDALGLLRKLPHGDQIETGTLTVEIEGQEPDVLVLPLAMIEALLEGVGAGPSAAPADPAADPAAEPLEPLEVEQLEAADAGEVDDKADAKLDARIARIVTAKLDAHEVKRKKADARDATVHADAATILPPAYDFTVPWAQVAVDAIAKVAPELEARARKLASDAKTDPVAEGMLRQMLADRRRTAAPGSVGLTVVASDASGEAPWLAPTMPERKADQ